MAPYHAEITDRIARPVTVRPGGRGSCPVARGLIEAGPRLVPTADASISAALAPAFEAKGMQVITGASVQALDRHGEHVTVHFSHDGRDYRAATEAVFAAVGWPANLRDLDLDAAGAGR